MSVINPKTKRSVKVNSKVFKTLLEDFKYDGNLLVPKNTSRYGFSTKLNHWIQMSKISKSYEKKDNIITLKEGLVKSPTNRYIKKDGKAFKKFLNLGYKFNNNSFIKPEISYDISDSDFKVFNFDKNKLKDAKQIVIITEDGDKKYVDMSSKDLIEAIKQKTYDEINDNIPFVIKVILTKKVKFGVAYEGNQNCFIQCIKTHIANQINYYKKSEKTKEKLNNKFNQYFNDFEEGVFEEDLQNIAEDWKLLIRIHESDNYEEYGKKSYTKNQTMLQLEYKNNHVELKEEKIKNEKEIINIGKCNCLDNLSFDTEIDCNHKIENYLSEIDVNDIEQIQLSNDDIIKLITADKIYKYKYYNDFELKDKEFTLQDKVSNELFDYFSVKPQSIKTDCDIVKQIINPMYYQLEKINANKEYINVDLKNAYDNFNELPTDLLIKCNTNKMHEQIGFYYIIFKCPIRKINISEWHSTEYLNVLNKHNVQYEIKQAMLSSNKTTLDIKSFNDKFKSYDKRVFHKILGKFQKYEYRKRHLTTDYEIVRKYGGHEVMEINDTTLYEFSSNKITNNTYFYYPHITGYIMENTHSKILDNILTNKLKPLRIWADNIILDKNVKSAQQCLKIPNTFHIDYKYKYKDDMSISYKTDNHSTLDIPESQSYYHIHSEDFVLGGAGTGKSTMINNQYIKNVNVLLLSPTNMALKNFKDYKNKMTIASFLEKEHNNLGKTELIIIDEISMVSQETYNLIKNKAKCRLISFGDFNQLQPVQGNPINYKSSSHTILTHIYRQEDKVFQQYTLDTLNNGNVDYITKQLSIKECIKNDILILSPKNNQIDNINKIGYQSNNSQIINDTFKVNSPIIITENNMKNKGLVNGDYGIIMSYNNDTRSCIINIADTNYTLTIDELTKNVKPAYSITYHKVQGQTFDKQICLNIQNLPKKQKNNMLYVGVSRVRKLEQLAVLQDFACAFEEKLRD
jgi:hypothetical protein